MIETILLKSPVLRAVLEKMPDLGLPNWYVGGGCVAQTVWNHISNRDFLADINDIDVAYFDRLDSSSETEAHRSDTIHTLLETPISLDVHNQARVHLWYESRFGYRASAMADNGIWLDTPRYRPAAF